MSLPRTAASIALASALAACSTPGGPPADSPTPLTPVPFQAAETQDDSSLERIETDRRVTVEANLAKKWVQDDWNAERPCDRTSVDGFDDHDHGGCRVPQAWRVSWFDGEEWRPVDVTDGEYGTEPDQYHEVGFEPVRSRALRLDVELWEGWSVGILEWNVDPGQ